LNLDVYVVTDRQLTAGRPLLWVVEESLAGGAKIIQLREKEVSTREFVELALQVREITRRYGARLIINDRVDVALAASADGVHLGQEDMPLPVARELVGTAIIGVSVATVEEAVAAAGADYLGVSAVFGTPTKAEAPAVGLEGLKKIREATGLPLVAIGGINAGNAAGVVRAGADGVAVVSAVMGARSPRRAVEELLQVVRSAQSGG
jgi:thiamine-phosphate pyrophosphorylase